MKYCYEGSTGGYPLEMDREEERYLEYIQSHHDCCICQDKNVPEEIMYKTDMGWMHIDCYTAIVEDPDTTKSETPIIL